MAVRFYQLDVTSPVFKRSWLKEVLQRRIEDAGKNLGEVSVIFCSDEYLLGMNREHLDHDYLTDVITFDFCDGKEVSGDIYISYERLKENARLFKEKLENEIVRVVGHGVCHLLGFRDKSEQEQVQMKKEEERILKMYTD